MASRKSRNSNAEENKGMRLIMKLPEPAVLAIPEKQIAYTPVRLSVDLANPSSIPITIVTLIGNLTPELVAPDGQVLPWQEPLERRRETREYVRRVIRAKEIIAVSLEVMLYWQNNQLLLAVPNVPDYYQQNLTPDDYWFSAPLQAGTYQFRFIYEPPTGEVTLVDRFLGQRRVENLAIGRLATEFVNLSLVEPVASHPSAVEVNGIRFETVMPERVLTLPETTPSSWRDIQVGIQVTNSTTVSCSFSFYDAIAPSLMRADGQILRGGYSMDWLGTAQESHFSLALSGESISFFPGVSLLRREDGQCIMVIAAGNGGVWGFETITSGTYRIQLEYINSGRAYSAYCPESRNYKRIEDVWTGLVSLPSVEFTLVSARSETG